METYYLDSKAQINGNHEIHKLDCHYFPSAANRIQIGKFNSCDEALTMAKEKYSPSKINGCFYCVKECHTN